MKILFVFLGVALAVGAGVSLWWSAGSREVLGADPMEPEGRIFIADSLESDRGMEKPGETRLRGPLESLAELVEAQAPTEPLPKSQSTVVVDVEEERKGQLNRLFEARYFGMTADELQVASTDLSQTLGVRHSEWVQVLISRGQGELVSKDDWSFGSSDDPDVMLGGYTDGTNFYKVAVHRHDAPDLFRTREELLWVYTALTERATEESH